MLNTSKKNWNPNHYLKFRFLRRSYFLTGVGFMIAMLFASLAHGQTLGNYNDTTIRAGENIIITPSAAPTGTAFISISSSKGFDGYLSVDETLGEVRVSNPISLGTFTVTLDAGNNVTTNFTLTVTPSECTQFGFIASSTSTIANAPVLMTEGDFNEDGFIDIATSNFSTSSISIRLGSATGFTSAPDFSVGNIGPLGMKAADFNGDGHDDLAIAGFNADSVRIKLGDGTGNFTGLIKIAVGVEPFQIADGDFDGDGVLDLAVSNNGGNTISLLKGDGTGGFTNLSTTTVGNEPLFIEAGYINADAHLDVVVGNQSSNTLSICYGNGSGSFSSVSTLTAGTGPNGIALADFDNNGQTDIAVANNLSDNLTIFLQNTPGVFSNSTYTVGDAPVGLDVGDLNGDAYPDLVVVNSDDNNVRVYAGSANGSFSSITAYSTTFSPVPVRIADLDQDGKMDLITLNTSSSELQVFKGTQPTLGSYANATMRVGEVTTFSPTALPSGARTLFVQADPSFKGVLTANAFSGEITVSNPQVAGTFLITVYEECGSSESFSLTVNNPSCAAGFAFVNGAQRSTPYTTYDVKLGDFNHDGNLDRFDISVDANTDNGYLSVSFGNGLGNYLSENNTYNLQAKSTTFFELGELNGDGNIDAAVGLVDDDAIGIYFGDGKSSFSSQTIIPNIKEPCDIKLGDLNNDGFTDFVTTEVTFGLGGQRYNVITGIGDGKGGFVINRINQLVQLGSPDRIELTDLNNDNNLDIVLSDSTYNAVSLYYGDGQGQFTSSSFGWPNPFAIVCADFNEDGYTDLAASDYGDSSITVFFNDSSGYFSTFLTTHAGPTPYQLEAIDANGDGHIDLAVANDVAEETSMLIGLGNGSFLERKVSNPAQVSKAIAYGDFDNDSIIDRFIAGPRPSSFGNYIATELGQKPILPNYPSSTVGLGGQLVVTPNNSPGGITSLLLTGGNGFEGQLTFDSETGAIRITNARPAGIHTILIETPCGDTTTFQLTVVDGLCSDGSFQVGADITVPHSTDNVAIGDFNEDGHQEVLSISESQSNFYLALGDGDGNFPTTTQFSTTGVGAIKLTLGDFNRDGHLDAAILTGLSDNITIALGDGNANFTVAYTQSCPSPYAIATADFNQDGILDLITGGGSNIAEIGIVFGNGTGGFTNYSSFITTYYPRDFTVGDLNNDGFLDIASAGTFFGSHALVFYLGNGMGQFPSYGERPNSNLNISVASADLNADGRLDIVLSQFGTNTGQALVYMNQGSNSYIPTAYTVDEEPVGLVLADCNGDGHIDITTVNNENQNVSVLLNNGAGGYGSKVDYSVGVKTNRGAIGDINEDGVLDLVVNSAQVPGAKTLLGVRSIGEYPNTSVQTGAQTTIQPTTPPNGLSALTVSAPGNFKGILSVDQTTGDMRITNARPAGSYNLYFNGLDSSGCLLRDSLELTVSDPNCSNGLFTSTIDTSFNATTYSNAIADFNRDGFQDYLVGFQTVDPIIDLLGIRFGNGAGGFLGNGFYNVSVGKKPLDIAVADLNQDGHEDFVTADFSSNSISILLGNGFSATSSFIPVGVNPSSLAIADINADGFVDIAVNSEANSTIHILESNGDGTFANADTITVTGTGTLTDIAFADFNKDGHVDLAAVKSTPDNFIFLFEGDGSGSFSAPVTLTGYLGNEISSLHVADLNLDGNLDLIAGNEKGTGSSYLLVYLGQDSLSFAPVHQIALVQPGDLEIGDFNGDGTPDLATLYNDTITTYIGLGNGQNFIVTSADSAAQNHTKLVSGDFNSDGVLDLFSVGQDTTTSNARIYIGGGSATLGSYPAKVSVQAGSQFTIVPTVPPTQAASISAVIDSGFAGTVLADPQTGEVSIVNAQHAGNYNLVIYAGCVMSDTICLTVTDPFENCVTFSGGIDDTISLGAQLFSSVISDFNGDGHQDVATMESGSNSFLAVRLGNGNGGFLPSVPKLKALSFTDIGRFQLQAEDFNGDGKMDLLASVRNPYDEFVSVLIGDGLGNFTENLIPTGGDVISTVIKDLNNDGHLDLAMAVEVEINSLPLDKIQLFYGNGLGGFIQAGEVEFPNGSISKLFATDLSSSDANIGLVAIATTNGIGLQSFYFELDSTNTFQLKSTSFITDLNLGSVELGDINNDGLDDLVITTYNFNLFQFGLKGFLCDGNGGFTLSFEEEGYDLNFSHTLGDVNGDGHLDVMVPYLPYANGYNYIVPYLGDGTGMNMTPATDKRFIISPGNAANAQLGDFNEDGSMDLAVSTLNGTLHLTLSDPVQLADYPDATVGQAGQTTISPIGMTIGVTSMNVYATDPAFDGILTGDPASGVVSVTNAKNAGIYDIIVQSQCGSTRSFTLTIDTANCSPGVLNSVQSVAVGSEPISMALGDFNEDGNQDMVVGNFIDQNITVNIGNGVAGFIGTPSGPIALSHAPARMAITALNGDGHQDIAMPVFGIPSESILILHGDGSANFAFADTLAEPAGAFDIEVADLDNDGIMDIISAGRTNNQIAIFFGFDNYNSQSSVPTGSTPQAIGIADIDGNGFLDIATVNRASNDLTYLLNTNGIFQPAVSIPVGTRPYAVQFGDLNADGHVDFVTGNLDSDDITIALGDGTGTFPTVTTLTQPGNPEGIDLADLNGDGHLDIAVSYTAGIDSVSVLFGDGSGLFLQGPYYQTGEEPLQIFTGDFDNNGQVDVATVSSLDDQIDILVGINEITWNGSLDTNWFDQENWTPKVVPNECSDVTIPATTNKPVISGSASVRDISMLSGSELTVWSKSCFSVNGQFSNNGDFFLRADTTGYAQYQGPSVEATMEQVIASEGWHTIASPFTNTTLADIQFTENAFLQIGNKPQCNIQYYDNGVFQPNPPANWINAGGTWMCPTSLNESFDGTRAYNLYLDDTYFADAFPVKMTVKGLTR
jgi:hypothetical protein